MNIYKRISAVIVCLAILLGTTAVYADKALTDVGIYDAEGKISDEAKQYITNKNNSLYSKTGAKVFFVLTPTAGGENLSDYANNLFDRENINYYGKKNSVLVIITTDEKDYWAKSAVSVSRILTDKVMGEFLVNAFEPYFFEDNYSEGIINLYDEISGWYMEHYELTDLNDVLATDEEETTQNGTSVLEIIEKVLFILVLLLLFAAITLYLIRIFVKSELKKRRQQAANVIDHTNIDELIDELPDKPKRSKKLLKIKKHITYEPEAVQEHQAEEIEVAPEPEPVVSGRYKFSAGIDIEKEFADIDIDEIINKNTDANSNMQ